MVSHNYFPSKPPPPHYNFQLFIIFILFFGIFFCNFDGYSRFRVFHLILFHDRRTSAPLHGLATQCHLFKSLCRKYFYKLPKSRLAGKFQMCFHEQAIRSRWCLSPVLNVPQEHWGLYAPLRASLSGSVLCSWKTLWICQPIIIKF